MAGEAGREFTVQLCVCVTRLLVATMVCEDSNDGIRFSF